MRSSCGGMLQILKARAKMNGSVTFNEAPQLGVAHATARLPPLNFATVIRVVRQLDSQSCQILPSGNPRSTWVLNLKASGRIATLAFGLAAKIWQKCSMWEPQTAILARFGRIWHDWESNCRGQVEFRMVYDDRKGKYHAEELTGGIQESGKKFLSAAGISTDGDGATVRARLKGPLDAGSNRRRRRGPGLDSGKGEGGSGGNEAGPPGCECPKTSGCKTSRCACNAASEWCSDSCDCDPDKCSLRGGKAKGRGSGNRTWKGVGSKAGGHSLQVDMR